MRDPRIAASDADLRAQYALAQEIEALHARVTDSRTQAQALERTSLPAAKRATLRVEIAGEAPPDNPDDSDGRLFARLHELSLPAECARLSRKRRRKRRRRADARYAFPASASCEAIYAKTLARLEGLCELAPFDAVLRTCASVTRGASVDDTLEPRSDDDARRLAVEDLAYQRSRSAWNWASASGWRYTMCPDS